MRWFRGYRILTALSSVLISGTALSLTLNDYKWQPHQESFNDGHLRPSFVLEDSNVTEGRGDPNNNDCGLYFAPSTIPGAGNGLYAAKPFAPHDLVALGDVTIPIFIDIELHSIKPKSQLSFLWSK